MEKSMRFSASGRRPPAALKTAPEALYDCGDLDSLQESYREAVEEFTENAKKLRAATDAPATEYALLSNLAKRSKVRAQAARWALRNHIIEHACC
jgi:hypothetical protein